MRKRFLMKSGWKKLRRGWYEIFSFYLRFFYIHRDLRQRPLFSIFCDSQTGGTCRYLSRRRSAVPMSSFPSRLARRCARPQPRSGLTTPVTLFLLAVAIWFAEGKGLFREGASRKGDRKLEADGFTISFLSIGNRERECQLNGLLNKCRSTSRYHTNSIVTRSEGQTLRSRRPEEQSTTTNAQIIHFAASNALEQTLLTKRRNHEGMAGGRRAWTYTSNARRVTRAP